VKKFAQFFASFRPVAGGRLLPSVQPQNSRSIADDTSFWSEVDGESGNQHMTELEVMLAVVHVCIDTTGQVYRNRRMLWSRLYPDPSAIWIARMLSGINRGRGEE